MINKKEVLTEVLQGYYNSDYRRINCIQKEDRRTYKVSFGNGIAMTVNNIDNSVYINLTFSNTDIDAKELIKDISMSYIVQEKNKLVAAQERFKEASADFSI
mgnify:FL=1